MILFSFVKFMTAVGDSYYTENCVTQNTIKRNAIIAAIKNTQRGGISMYSCCNGHQLFLETI
jgi:hypothetical protein